MTDPATIAKQIAAIMEKHGPFCHSIDEAIAEASQAWDGGANEFGVFTHGTKEVVARHKDAEASVIVTASPNGLFAHAVKLHSFDYGLGSMPSIWGEAFSTHEEAFN